MNWLSIVMLVVRVNREKLELVSQSANFTQCSFLDTRLTGVIQFVFRVFKSNKSNYNKKNKSKIQDCI